MPQVTYPIYENTPVPLAEDVCRAFVKDAIQLLKSNPKCRKNKWNFWRLFNLNGSVTTWSLKFGAQTGPQSFQFLLPQQAEDLAESIFRTVEEAVETANRIKSPQMLEDYWENKVYPKIQALYPN